MLKRLPAALLVLLLLIPLLFCCPAQACPVCDSDRAVQVRAALFDSRFAANLGVTALPFVVLAAVVALTYYGPTVPGRGPGKGGAE